MFTRNEIKKLFTKIFFDYLDKHLCLKNIKPEKLNKIRCLQ
jgi:hypothetical protein